MKNNLVFLISISLIICLSSTVLASWQLYDDFNSTNIDTQKWSKVESSANISIENGEAKFVHNSGFPNDASWLRIKDNPQNIIGIRTKIRVESCTGDVMGRAGGYTGKFGDNPLYSVIGARSDEGRVISYINLKDPVPPYENVEKIFSGYFRYDLDNPDILGKTFIIEWLFRPNQMAFKTNEVTGTPVSYGEIIFKHPEAVSPNENHQKAIGTISEEGDGPCTIYFDDVYVYRQISSAGNFLLLFEEE